MISYPCCAEVVEWQTRWLQVPVVAIPCGFKSHLLHLKQEGRSIGLPFMNILNKKEKNDGFIKKIISSFIQSEFCN